MVCGKSVHRGDAPSIVNLTGSRRASCKMGSTPEGGNRGLRYAAEGDMKKYGRPGAGGDTCSTWLQELPIKNGPRCGTVDSRIGARVVVEDDYLESRSPGDSSNAVSPVVTALLPRLSDRGAFSAAIVTMDVKRSAF